MSVVDDQGPDTRREDAGMGPATAPHPTAFASILFQEPPGEEELERLPVPVCFADLHLDRIFEQVVAGRAEYGLDPFFRLPLADADAIAYRHEILRDLERAELCGPVRTFAQAMRDIRRRRAQEAKLHHEFQRASWFLETVALYCIAVGRLSADLSALDISSRGFRALTKYLAVHVDSAVFRSLVAETKQRQDALAQVAYCVQIKGKRVTVSRYAGEPDYSVQVEETFRKFRQGAVESHLAAFRDAAEMNPVEEIVLDQVARLYPEVFVPLREYCDHHADYLDETIRRFDREVQFYLAYMEFTAGLTAAGLPFCYPRVSEPSPQRSQDVGRSGTVRADDAFDLALAAKLVGQGAAVIGNSFHLDDPERIIVVSGPNQGGKTTFARTFGQLHYVAGLGYPVPGRQAELFLCDRIFTHFEREEHIESLRSKLQDELVRIHDILEQATGDSLIVMNESFASTTLSDNLFLGTQVLRQIVRRGILCVYVTFIDELSSLDPSVVSMMSTVEPDNPAQRTFKVVRQPADGLAYAAALAAKYGLTYESVQRRVAR